MKALHFLWCMAISLVWKAQLVDSCFNAVNRNARIVNVTEKANFILYNPANLTDYDLTVTYTWDVQIPEDETLDGFLYCFEDADAASIEALSKRSIPFPGIFSFPGAVNPGFPSSDPLAGCQHYINKTFWVTDQNGSYVDCPFPCEDEIGPPCVLSSVCSTLRDRSCTAVNKSTKTATFEISFGRKYSFMVYPYTGMQVSLDGTGRSEKVVLFCGHHLVETVGVHHLKAYEFCRSEQNISELSTASSPPSNFRLYRVYDNFDDHSATVVIRWKAPHDVVRGKRVTRYFFKIVGHGKADVSERVTQESDTPDTYYNVTVTGLQYNQTHRFTVTPIVDREPSECGILGCQEYGDRAHLSFFIQGGDVDACSVIAGTNKTTYCDEHADCVDVKPNRIYPANCSCWPGYYGNGVLEVWENGEGCKNVNACLTRLDSNHVCHPNALCEDDEPPSMSASCSCPQGYFGDGYRNGSGCTETRFVIGIAVGVPLALLAACVLFCSARRYQRLRKRALDLKISKFVVGSSYTSPLVLANNNITPNSSAQYDSVFGRKWEVERDQLTQLEVIGRGNFGVVHKSQWLKNDTETTVVATKSLTGAYTSIHKEDFLAEMALLISLGPHPNVLSVLGVCTSMCSEDTSPLLLTEYMPYGDLLHFLWSARESAKRRADPAYDFTEASLYNIGRQVACGMHFLFRSKVIHGDVAARNILVGKNLKCKISDFGLANDVYRYGLIKGSTERRVPFKWVSPERMLGGQVPITWRSDVWSFGILLYEMVTLGGAPYPGMDHVTILSSLKKGYRMPRPDSCSEYLYKVMMDCWEWTAIKRPTFIDLEERLKSVDWMTSSSIQAMETVDTSKYEADIGRRDLGPETSETAEDGQRCTDDAVISNVGNGVQEQEVSRQNETNGVGSTQHDFGNGFWTGDLFVRLESDA
nr:uncharacterized protein LOC100183178 isoform X1 [Ciona intestinalis]|eukprot:XP_026692900.1 uncharacterized protein LOC100183178 isoform X1 [Ciona intestinalis]